MIARLYVILPFSVTIPDGEKFIIYEYEDDGYKIRISPPIKSDRPTTHDNSDEILIKDVPAFQANALRIDFHRENFDCSAEIKCDPPYPLIARTINSFLHRLRFVTRASQVKSINFPLVSWQLYYLNDDESELEPKKGLVRGRGSASFSFSALPLTKDIWNHIQSLPTDFVPPQWDTLILDALAALPDVGQSVVLAATALEVFISHVLNEMAKKSSVPKELWEWINAREGLLKQPSTEEQFDDLLKILSGSSLKENNSLWRSFKNLRKARNSFVHEGIARVDNKSISVNDAQKLLAKATEIMNFVRNKLPDLFLPELKYSMKVQFRKQIFRA